MANHSIHRRHHGWDRDRAPVLEVAPGDVVEFAVQDASDGQLDAASTAADVGVLDLDRANPVTGPIAVAGAEPGHTLVVTIEEVATEPWGWTAVIPGFGLLAEDLPDPHLVLSKVEGDEVRFGDIAVLSPDPFIGTIGVAPAEAGPLSVIPPRRVGGNMDLRDVRAGAILRLPVEVPGALLSVGDTHVVQGDGEVCGTAVETSATVRLRIDLETDRDIATPHVTLPEGDRRIRGPRSVTTGIGPDLLAATRDAVRAQISMLVQRGLDPADAYALVSVAGHLRIGEIVDAPNWLVACELPTAILI